MKILLSLFLVLTMVGCSGNKSLEDVAEGAGVDVPSEDEFEEDFAEEAGDAIAEEVGEAVDDALGGDDEFASEDGEEGFGEELADDGEEGFGEEGFGEETESEGEGMVSSMTDGGTGMEATTSTGGESTNWEAADGSGQHTVKAGETLMIIAFKIYGDYERWRELARMNAGKLGPRYTVSVGTVINYNPPAEPFQWTPSGNAYLIRVGDTLGTISRDTYGTNQYWRAIWKNNTPLIKDPNRIFAGFTIYTPIMDGRGVANEDM